MSRFCSFPYSATLMDMCSAGLQLQNLKAIWDRVCASRFGSEQGRCEFEGTCIVVQLLELSSWWTSVTSGLGGPQCQLTL